MKAKIANECLKTVRESYATLCDVASFIGMIEEVMDSNGEPHLADDCSVFIAKMKKTMLRCINAQALAREEEIRLKAGRPKPPGDKNG